MNFVFNNTVVLILLLTAKIAYLDVLEIRIWTCRTIFIGCVINAFTTLFLSKENKIQSVIWFGIAWISLLEIRNLIGY